MKDRESASANAHKATADLPLEDGPQRAPPDSAGKRPSVEGDAKMLRRRENQKDYKQRFRNTSRTLLCEWPGPGTLKESCLEAEINSDCRDMPE